MTEDKQAFHKKLGIELFNKTWDLIDKEEKTQEEIDRMIHSAHASRYHWEFPGEPVNFARGEWQISRVYALVNRAEPCLYHAKRCLQITQDNDLKDFDLGFAYEAMARAYAIAGDKEETAKYLSMAETAAEQIAKDGDREYFMSELKSIS
jgi:hypothetical protein